MKTVFFALALSLAGAVYADELQFEIRGLYPPLIDNARNNIENLAASDNPRLGNRRLARLRQEAEQRILASLRPFGFYQAAVTSSVVDSNGGPRTVVFEVERGRPVRITHVDVSVTGPGASLPAMEEWLENWPLTEGSVLKHGEWETAKQQALDLLDYRGYVAARFTQHRIELDLEKNQAALFLELETGAQAVMGEVRFEQDVVRVSHRHSVQRLKEQGQDVERQVLARAVKWHLEDRVIIHENKTLSFFGNKGRRRKQTQVGVYTWLSWTRTKHCCLSDD